MSKKKAKNSNYKNNIGMPEEVNAKVLTKEQKEHIIIFSVVAVIVLGLIIAAIISCIPKYTYVEMDFGDFGKIVIKVDEKVAPITSENFISLVEDGFYDGLTIFRAQKNFVIQGGKDTSANLTPIKGEFEENGIVNNLSHTKGVISMARTGENDSATSQFFITLHDQAADSLDGKYAGFGYVVEGMDVVESIADCLFDHAIDSMGFVADKDAITIVSAKVIHNYREK